MLLSWDYYRSLLYSAVIAFMLVSIVYLVTIKLDRRYDWNKHPAKRVGLQLALALVLPAILAFLLATLYFRLFDIDIFVTRYLTYDYPVILLMLLLVNVYYVAFYFYRQWKTVRENLSNMPAGVERPSKDVIMTSKADKVIPIAVRDICYFYHLGELNMLRTFQKEDVIVDYSLDELEKILPPMDFFRVNRQFIVNRRSCEKYALLSYGKLELYVTPVFNSPVIISQKRAPEFKKWLDR
ncbi:MAG: LytTR family transcriptional regulator DNA-binding domain-containing protein [Bacteroidetes bacterium]|nr:LytTR family transcriptional regulator DNA-binding domain-containing protein [Bacteroidota bacterium]